VLARRLPREVDRWGLVERVGRLAPDVLAPVTLPDGAQRARPAPEALLYAPGHGGGAGLRGARRPGPAAELDAAPDAARQHHPMK
jgi:hypothetical protein